MAEISNDQYESLRRLASLWRGGSEKEAEYSDAIFNALEAVDTNERLRAAVEKFHEWVETQYRACHHEWPHHPEGSVQRAVWRDGRTQYGNVLAKLHEFGLIVA